MDINCEMSIISQDHPGRMSRVCTKDCIVCSQKSHSRLSKSQKSFSFHADESLKRLPEEWKVVEGSFAGIMLVVMPCRSQKSSKGVARYGHLSDGNIHLVMVKRCSRFQYLRFLMRLSNSGLEAGSLNSYVEVVHAVAVKITEVHMDAFIFVYSHSLTMLKSRQICRLGKIGVHGILMVSF